MFHNYEDHRFKKIIDEFILSSPITDDNKQLSCTIRNIDLQAAKLGISFYQMMFILTQEDAQENKKRKEWLSKDIF